MSGLFLLNGVVKNYDWGGYRFIPRLTGVKNDENRPFAEYWMGTHPLGMGQIISDGGNRSLESVTGPLPFLLKVLDIRDMLSIQVHPDKEGAREGFERENAAGIPLDAVNRNYKDANHKPELMVALGDFWLLHGFKPPEELIYTLLNVVELRELLPVYNATGYSGLYRHIMEMPQTEVDRILGPLVSNIANLYTEDKPDRYEEDFWASRAAAIFNRKGFIDRGIFSIYLFNLVHLKKGEGIYQAPGIPHAYLEGQNVEIMANSDNVLRGGLTTKHIDVAELLKHVKCEAAFPDILSGKELHRGQFDYETPAEEFRLEMIRLEENRLCRVEAPQGGSSDIFLLTEGAAEAEGTGLVLKPGQVAAVAVPGTNCSFRGLEPGTVIFRARSGRK